MELRLIRLRFAKRDGLRPDAGQALLGQCLHGLQTPGVLLAQIVFLLDILGQVEKRGTGAFQGSGASNVGGVGTS